MAKKRNRGKPRTPEIIEDFIEFLHCVKGLSLRDIAEFTGVKVRTVYRIAKRNNFKEKSGTPQTLDDTIHALDETFRSSVGAVNEFMTDDLLVGEGNVHQHISSQKNMIEVRRGALENATYHTLKVALEALKDVETWLQTTNALTEDHKKVGALVLNTYRAEKTAESVKFLQSIAK